MPEITPEEWRRKRDATWLVPERFGFPDSASMAGSVGGPFLAGFSLTAAIVTLPYRTHLVPWRDWSIVLFLTAAMLFLFAVHANYWARLYVTTPKQILAWWPCKDEIPPEYMPFLIAEQKTHYKGFEMWARRSRLLYDIGVLCLMIGLTFVVIPPGDNFSVSREIAISFGGFACVVEIAWQLTARRCLRVERKQREATEGGREVDSRKWSEKRMRPLPCPPSFPTSVAHVDEPPEDVAPHE